MAKRRKQKRSLRRFLPAVDVGLGIFLGCLFAAGYLALKPVAVRDAVPRADEEEAERHEIIYVRGRSGLVRPSVVEARERAILARSSVQLAEEEINRWISNEYGRDKRTREFPTWEAEFRADLPVFRIAGDETQMGIAYDFSVLGLTRKVVLQAAGGFRQEGGRFVFVPDSMYVGSCPVNIPYLSRRIFDVVSGGFEVSEDLRNAWTDVRQLVVERGSMKIDFNPPAVPEPAVLPQPAPEEVTPAVSDAGFAEDVSAGAESEASEGIEPAGADDFSHEEVSPAAGDEPQTSAGPTIEDAGDSVEAPPVDGSGGDVPADSVPDVEQAPDTAPATLSEGPAPTESAEEEASGPEVNRSAGEEPSAGHPVDQIDTDDQAEGPDDGEADEPAVEDDRSDGGE